MISKFLRSFMSRRTIFAKLRNKFMNTYANYELVKKARVEFETERQESCAPHTVIYFHKVDDPYSALTIEYVDKIISSYDLVLKPILVGEENPETIHEPTLYSDYCLRDVNRIADYYGVEFSSNSYPKKNLINLANSILTAVDETDFVDIARKVSKLLWLHDQKSLKELALKHQASSDTVIKRLDQGNTLRNEKDYYFGSAFYYGKELYWGVDRINYLEERLDELVCDGLLLSTPAGSTAYNLSAHGPILPLTSNLLALTPISAFRPRRWKGALLPRNVKVKIVILERNKRPVSAVADNSEFRDIEYVEISENKNVELKMLFDPKTNLEERIINEQFIY